MKIDEFNKKYTDYIECRFLGLEFDNPEVIAYLDEQFQAHIKNHPDFKISQIKMKFGTSRVYTNAGLELEREWEHKINEIMNGTRTSSS